MNVPVRHGPAAIEYYHTLEMPDISNALPRCSWHTMSGWQQTETPSLPIQRKSTGSFAFRHNLRYVSPGGTPWIR